MAIDVSVRNRAPARPRELSTLPHVLQWRAIHQPNEPAFTFLIEGEDEAISLTYAELDREARTIAGELQRLGGDGARALLVYDSGLDYIAALYGCLYAGVVAAPVYPPDPFRIDRTLPRLQAIIADAQASFLLATSATLEWAGPLFRKAPGLTSLVATDAIAAERPLWRGTPAIDRSDLAILQYTSGSTGTPRGVVISHSNLLANLARIEHTIDREGVIAVSWLPAYHDMGLIGGVFQPVYSGRHTILMSPLSFIQRPVRWLRAISNYRAWTTAAPNFAYDLCVRKISRQDRKTLDLSSLSLALNGAERVREETMDRFAEAFAECGFRREAFYPCYGLAEATLMVAGGEIAAPPVVRSYSAAALERDVVAPAAPGERVSRLVGCGKSVYGQTIVIADPVACTRLPERRVGEIWVSGPSVGLGYWNRPEETERSFHARLATGERPFLRTGDLGFFDDGELFVTGRVKEMIVICGRNLYPQDIELTVAHCHEALKLDGGAAFSIDVDGEERLVIVQEVFRPKRIDPAALLQTIRNRVAEEHGVPVYAVALIAAGGVPKTSSGKTRRRTCRDYYLAGRLNTVLAWRSGQSDGAAAAPRRATAPRNATEKRLAALWCEVLGLETVGIHDDFFDHGGQSLLATQLLARIRAALGIELPLRSLFESPTIAQLAERIAAAETEREMTPALRRVARGATAELSFSQQRLWVLEQLETAPRYNVPASAALRGPLDVEMLQKSLNLIVARHETLRTNFQALDGRTLQTIHPARNIPLKFVDLRSENAAAPGSAAQRAERLEQAQRAAAADAERPFDLERDPLVRAALYRIADDEHLLAIAAHHIVVDGWSMGVFLKELTSLYQDAVAGRAPSLPELPLQYADFAAWQRDWLQSPAMDRQLRYWTDQFKQLPPALDLAADKPRRAEAQFHGASEIVCLSAELTAALEQLSRREGATLYMTLLAAFETLLARWTGQTDLCVGTPVANRTRVELEPLIGYFVNTLPLRADLSDQPSFRQLLARTRETTLGALANQDLPLDKLIEVLRPQRGTSGSPLFQTMFVFENIAWPQTEAAGLSIGEVRIEHGALSSFDLTLVVEPQAGELAATLVYNADLFEPATIRQMLAAFETLLAGIAADPETSVAQLPLMPPAEERRWNAALNETAVSFPADRGIHELFAEQAARTPDALAVVCGDVRWTYRELDRRSNQLARYLQAAGVGPEVPVGICLKRSAEMLPALLGVLKAGGAYVPLDPGEAPERLARIIDDLRLPWLLTTRECLAQLPPHEAEEVLLDVEWPAVAEESDQPFASRVAPEQLAYVIYTSGSTGQPKGVEIAHRGLVNHATELARRYRSGAGDRVLQVISLGFDAAGEEIFPALISGAALVLPGALVELSGRQILDDCRRHGITILHLPTVLWQQVVAELSPQDAEIANRLKVLLVGGETPAAETMRQWQTFCRGRVRFLHAYGLTEATITSTLFEIAPGESLELPQRLPIGRPIANTQAYVLDEGRRPVPPGVPGELYLGGVGLARGYRNAAAQSRERFVDNPFDPAPGARLLRSGDRVRLRPDGQLEFLGRIDRQIKLRGFRIEPGEIERALLEHPAIREAAVLCREDARGSKRLSAYVVPAGDSRVIGESLTTSEVRRWLRSKLPEYMLPSAVVALDALPLTSHHKIDFDALTLPDRSNLHRDERNSAPRTPMEETLVAIWAKALGIDRVGIHDNFFELGGDSILSIQVVARAREAGLRFTPKQLFERQTIAELAAVEGMCQLLDAEQGPIVGPSPLTPIQRWFLDSQPADPQHFNQAMLLEVDASLSPEQLAAALVRLSLHHDALRLRFELGSEGWRQWHADEPGWPMENFDLSKVPTEQQPAAMLRASEQLQASLDLAAGPIARAGWFDLGVGRPKRLLLAIHHLAVDAVSWRILLEDLTTICGQLSRGETPALLPKTTSFGSWAGRLEELASADETRREAPFWLVEARRLVRRLPADAPAGENACAGAREVSTQLEPEETTALLERAHAAYRTEMNDVLLAALTQALSDWTRDWRWLVDLEGHGRLPLYDDVDLSRTVGWFTSCFPVLLELPESGRPGDVLRRVKDELRRTPRWGLSHGLLRYLRQDELAAELAAAPAAEISFNYLGRFDGLLAPEGPFAAAGESCGATQSPRNARRHLLEVNAFVRHGRLHVEWTYCERIHRRETIERLAKAYVERLRELISHCTSEEAGGDAASDFPLAGINEQGMKQLAQLLDQLDQNE